MKTKFDELKAKYPDWNWAEAEEIDYEDLKAAAAFYDRLKNILELPVMFGPWKCYINAATYNNDRKAILLKEMSTHEDIAIATTSVRFHDIPDDEVFIKEYSENEGMTDALITAGVIEKEPTQTVKLSFVTVKSYKLTAKALKLWERQPQK